MIVQPILGAVSDNFRPTSTMQPTQAIHPWGTGTLGTVASMMGLAWIGEQSLPFKFSQAKMCVKLSDWCSPLSGFMCQCFPPTATGRHPHYALRVMSKAAASTSRFLVQYNHSNRQRLWILLGVMSLQELGIPLISRMTQFQALCTIISIPPSSHNHYDLFVGQRRYPRSL